MPEEDDDLARNFDIFGPGPEPSALIASAGIAEDTIAQSPSVEERMHQLTNETQELTKFITTGVATQSAQPLEGAAQGAPAASSSDALGSYKPGGLQIPLLKLRETSAAYAGSGPPPDSPSSSSSGSSSSSDGDKPACRIKCHEKDCPKLTANNEVRRVTLQGVVQVEAEVAEILAQIRAPIVMLQPVRQLRRKHAEPEEETIRLNSLSDLTFPSPPGNAAHARAYINQVLMAIGKIQRTAGMKLVFGLRRA